MSSRLKNRQVYCYPDSVKTLIISDTRNVDSMVLKVAAEAKGIQLDCFVVYSIKEFSECLLESNWELVISFEQAKSDCSFQVLKKLHNFTSIPLITIIKSADVDRVEHLLDGGVEDVISLPYIARLGVVVRRLLSYKLLEKKLEFSEKQAALYLASSGDGFWDWYIDDGIVHFSERWVSMLHYDYKTFNHSFSNWLDYIHPNDLGKFLVVWSDYMEGLSSCFAMEYRILDGNGNYRWIEVRGVSVASGENEPMHLAGSHNDITLRKEAEIKQQKYKESLEIMVTERTNELRQLNKKLSYISTIDALTDVPNRRCFNDYIEQEFIKSQKEGKALSLMIIDIDFFKAVNDTYGHLVGDECIKQVAKALEKSLCRPADQVARYGGEEFTILLPNTNEKEARVISDQIFSNIASLKTLPVNPKTNKQITVSIGLNSFNPKNKNVSMMGVLGFISAADKVLYRAKESGRNQLMFASN